MAALEAKGVRINPIWHGSRAWRTKEVGALIVERDARAIRWIRPGVGGRDARP